MKIIKLKVIRFILFIGILLTSFNLHAENTNNERKFILFAKLPIIPKISLMELKTNLSIIDKDKYELSFKVKTLNFVDYINNINGEGFVEGSIINNIYYPKTYNYNYVRKSKKKSVSLKYLNKNIVENKFIPVFDKNKLTPISENEMIDTIDPATLFLRLLDINKTDKCNQIIKVYDGKRRYDVIFDEIKIENLTIECSAFQKRIGGYKKDKIDPLTNTDLIKIKYQNSLNNNFLEFYAKKGLIEIMIEEIN